MAKKRQTAAKAAASSVTPERFVRLYRMVHLLAEGPHTREVLVRRLRLDVRGFYRDLDLLRSAGVTVTLDAGRYTLHQKADDALALLPFPDPRLTLGAVRALAKGRSQVQRALADTLAHPAVLKFRHSLTLLNDLYIPSLLNRYSGPPDRTAVVRTC